MATTAIPSHWILPPPDLQIKMPHSDNYGQGKNFPFYQIFNTAYGENGNKEEIVNLGMRYNLLTAHTSFVAVHEVVRNPEAQSRDIRQPLSLPAGVSEFAVGAGC